MGLHKFIMLVSLSLAALATFMLQMVTVGASGVGHQDIEVVNDSGVGIDVFLVDTAFGKLSLLHEGPVDRNVKINNLMTGSELEIHEVCGTATTEERTCRKVNLKVPEENETPGEISTKRSGIPFFCILNRITCDLRLLFQYFSFYHQ
jgi:hypothetical protein